MWLIYGGILLSHKKNQWNNAICSNMDGSRDYHTKWIMSEKDKYHMVSFTCGIKKKWYKWTYLQNRNSLTDIKNKLMVTKGEMRGRDESEGWSEHTHTIAFKTDNQQGILYSTVNSIWDSVIPYKEKNPKEWIYVYVELNHSAVHLKLTQYCKPTIRQ